MSTNDIDMAHDGQESDDPAMTLTVIERLAAEAPGVMYGHFCSERTIRAVLSL